MGIIRSVLTADPDEIAVIRSALDAKSTSEAVIREQRATLSKPVPPWAVKLSDSTVLTVEFLDELDAALGARMAVLNGYPEGPKRNTARERHQLAQNVVSELRASLTGEDPGGAGEHTDNHNGAHHQNDGVLAAG